ncbi:hypothetical protein NE237_003588 [Protea cynaroides]|uniref:Uncharacterized protein n=1 Tax=Protea cynaroides TaxID=273540 RepID=A0A9Q0KHB7_9MAGN|nr:hypothetical protein NE237_003588 [Protea cynaroides]
MGLFSLLASARNVILKNRIFSLTDNAEKVIVRSISFDGKDRERTQRTVSLQKEDSDTNSISDGSDKMVIEESISFKNRETEKMKFEAMLSFKNLVLEGDNESPVSPRNQNDDFVRIQKPKIFLPKPNLNVFFFLQGR